MSILPAPHTLASSAQRINFVSASSWLFQSCLTSLKLETHSVEKDITTGRFFIIQLFGKKGC